MLELLRFAPYACTQMTADPSIAALELRLGTAHFRRRLATEHDLKRPARRFTESPRSTIAKLVLNSTLIRACLHRLGLHRRGYEQFLNPQIITRNVLLPNLPPELNGVTILQISDLHLDLDPGFVPALTRHLAGLSYDLAVITGDFRNKTGGPSGPSIAGTIELMKHIRQPVYAVLGNHDSLEMVPPLESAGLRFLLNEHIVWSHHGANLVLAGVDDAVFHQTHDLTRAFANTPAGTIRVLLSHSPELYAEAAAHGVHLFLAGHTHGGQICLPGGRIVISGLHCPRRFLRGAWNYEGVQGYTSSGTGACGVPLRFHCPAEITLHKLVKA